MSPTAPEVRNDDDVLVHAEELKRIRVERERLDARELVVYERMSSALARRLGSTARTSSLPPQAPPPQRVRGRSDQIVNLLREHPDASTAWLVSQVYGLDTPRNRRAFSCSKSQLRKAGKLATRQGGLP